MRYASDELITYFTANQGDTPAEAKSYKDAITAIANANRQEGIVNNLSNTPLTATADVQKAKDDALSAQEAYEATFANTKEAYLDVQRTYRDCMVYISNHPNGGNIFNSEYAKLYFIYRAALDVYMPKTLILKEALNLKKAKEAIIASKIQEEKVAIAAATQEKDSAIALYNILSELAKQKVEEAKSKKQTDCYKKTVKSGEVCTINVAKSLGIFDNTKYFDETKIPSDDILKIDKHIDNTIDETSPYSLCTMDGANAIVNCALNTKNPWKTLRTPANINCSMPLDIELPKEFSYDTDNNIVKPPPIYRYKPKVGYCQERWYDWFTIPDYHLGNKYVLYNNTLHPRDIFQCFKPCNIGFIPRDNKNTDVINKCVQKDHFQNGLYKNTFHYLPISLILLLGSTKTSLRKYNRFILDDIKNVVLNNDLILDETVFDNIYNNDTTFDNIYNGKTDDHGIKTVISNSIYELFKLPFDVENITVPDKNVLEVSKPIITKSKIQQAYNICKNYYDLSTDTKKIVDFNAWKNELALISSQNVNSVKFKKQLVILKQACNITFNGKSDYSKNYILYNLNKDIDINEVANPPIEFTITQQERQYNISDKNKQGIDEKRCYIDDATKLLKCPGDSGYDSSKLSTSSGGSSDGSSDPPPPPGTPPVLTYKQNPHLNDLISTYLPLSNEYIKYYKLANIIKLFLLIIVLILFIYIFIILSYIFSPYASQLLNFIYIILRNISLCFYDMVTHLFSFGKYKPDIYDMEASKLDLDNANRIVNKLQDNITKEKISKSTKDDI